jgi:hypothetical protein
MSSLITAVLESEDISLLYVASIFDDMRGMSMGFVGPSRVEKQAYYNTL